LHKTAITRFSVSKHSYVHVSIVIIAWSWCKLRILRLVAMWAIKGVVYRLVQVLYC